MQVQPREPLSESGQTRPIIAALLITGQTTNGAHPNRPRYATGLIDALLSPVLLMLTTAQPVQVSSAPVLPPDPLPVSPYTPTRRQRSLRDSPSIAARPSTGSAADSMPLQFLRKRIGESLLIPAPLDLAPNRYGPACYIYTRERRCLVTEPTSRRAHLDYRPGSKRCRTAKMAKTLLDLTSRSGLKGEGSKTLQSPRRQTRLTASSPACRHSLSNLEWRD